MFFQQQIICKVTFFFGMLEKSCTFAADFNRKTGHWKGARVVEEARLESE